MGLGLGLGLGLILMLAGAWQAHGRRMAGACTCSGMSSIMTASPPYTHGPSAKRSMVTAMPSCSGADHSMLMLPQAVISRPQSDDIRFESSPLSARPPPPSHSRSVSTRRHTAAAIAPRTSTPRCSACQKYWLTQTAWASVTTGSATAIA